MFKIVHCKGREEDALQILDNVEETSLSQHSPYREEEDEDAGPHDYKAALEDAETCVIEEQEYVHPENDDFFEEEDDDDDPTHAHDDLPDTPPRPPASRCACNYRGIHKLLFGVKKCVHSRPCSICVYLCLTLIVLASLVSLVVISVLIVVPYAQAATYQHSNCTPVGITVDSEDRRCSCGKGCSSLYTCMQVRVKIQSVNYTIHTELKSSILYENEAIFMRKVSHEAAMNLQLLSTHKKSQ